MHVPNWINRLIARLKLNLWLLPAVMALAARFISPPSRFINSPTWAFEKYSKSTLKIMSNPWRCKSEVMARESVPEASPLR